MSETENLGQPDNALRLQTCRLLIQERKRVGVHLGFHVCPDAAWDMLLDLYVAHHENRSITIWSLCLASNIPTSTAHRKIGELIESGIMVRGAQGGRVTVTVAPAFMTRLDALLDDLSKIVAPALGSDNQPPGRTPPPGSPRSPPPPG